jgi:UDPglucose 6-dehydrogenase
MKIGIVGQGYVGTAVKDVFKNHYEIETYDITKSLSSTESVAELAKLTDLVFVCVPTPMNSDGSCNTFAVEKVVGNIENARRKRCKIVAIKSTIPPGTTEDYNERCKNIQVLFNPEFLTEANFINDFRNQNRIIIGGPRPASTKLRQIYSLAFPNVPIIKTGSTTAEMVKYMTNSFLATKVSFANEMKMICDKFSIDYDKVVEYSTYDDRLGKSHWSVPGPDGKLGFGGSCFPKDIQALIHYCNENEIPAKTLIAAWDTNLKVRPEKDWEELKGRAVMDDE